MGLTFSSCGPFLALCSLPRQTGCALAYRSMHNGRHQLAATGAGNVNVESAKHENLELRQWVKEEFKSFMDCKVRVQLVCRSAATTMQLLHDLPW